MRAVVPIFIIVIAAFVVAFRVIDPLDDGGDAYRAENRRILESLSHPAGAEQLSQKDNAYYREGPSSMLKRPRGWTLNLVFQAPPGATADEVLAFYEQNVPPGWQLEVQEIPGRDLLTGEVIGSTRIVTYVRDEARVGINVDNLGPNGPGTYEVGIDCRGLRP